jgi:hypothetical protein
MEKTMDATSFLASVYRARVTLDHVIRQTLPSDDQILAGHVREAHETLRTALEIARQDDPEAYDKAQRIASQEIGR